MQLVEVRPNWFRFRLEPLHLDFFAQHRIRSREFGESRWKPGDVLLAQKHAQLESYLGVYNGMALPPWGAFTFAFSDLGSGIQIGRYCSISWNVRVMGPNHGTHLVSSSEMMYRRDSSFCTAFSDYGVDWTFRSNPQKPYPVIGNDVWIGQDVLLGRGLGLGDGCVVAAGSVVTKSVPPYAVVGGAPAKVVKYRFNERVVEEMLRIRWWDYALPQLNALSLDKPDVFVGEMAGLIASGKLEKMQSLGSTFELLKSLG